MSKVRKTPKRSVTPEPADDQEPSILTFAALPSDIVSSRVALLGVELRPPAYDRVQAEQALERLRPRLLGLRGDQLKQARGVQLDTAALAALNVYALCTQVDAIGDRLNALASVGEFQLSNIDELMSLAFVVLLLLEEADTDSVYATTAKVSASLYTQALELEARMQELCEYVFRRDEEIAPMLAHLRPGSGYADLARDLLGYARIYEMRPQEVARDGVNYRESDPQDARRIAGEIRAQLSASLSSRGKTTRDLLERSWTALLDVYSEVREACLYLLRHDASRDAWIPSLFAISRGGGAPRRSPAEPGRPEDIASEDPIG
jgi:hypothetical protein